MGIFIKLSLIINAVDLGSGQCLCTGWLGPSLTEDESDKVLRVQDYTPVL